MKTSKSANKAKIEDIKRHTSAFRMKNKLRDDKHDCIIYGKECIHSSYDFFLIIVLRRVQAAEYFIVSWVWMNEVMNEVMNEAGVWVVSGKTKNNLLIAERIFSLTSPEDLEGICATYGKVISLNGQSIVQDLLDVFQDTIYVSFQNVAMYPAVRQCMQAYIKKIIDQKNLHIRLATSSLQEYIYSMHLFKDESIWKEVAGKWKLEMSLHDFLERLQHELILLYPQKNENLRKGTNLFPWPESWINETD